MEEKNKKLIIKSLLIGGIVGSIVVAVRAKEKGYFTGCCKKTATFFQFINENRAEIIEQLRRTSDKVTRVIDESNHDLQVISENIKKIKNSSSQMISTVHETKANLANMYENCKEKMD